MWGGFVVEVVVEGTVVLVEGRKWAVSFWRRVLGGDIVGNLSVCWRREGFRV